jgi:hypothetical protein
MKLIALWHVKWCLMMQLDYISVVFETVVSSVPNQNIITLFCNGK